MKRERRYETKECFDDVERRAFVLPNWPQQAKVVMTRPQTKPATL